MGALGALGTLGPLGTSSSLAGLLLAAPGAELSSPLGPKIAWWALASLTVVGALVTITRRNAVSAVMALVATFFGLAGLYLMLSAEFLAALQVLVYAGAIMTLFVFVVMVLNREETEPWAVRGVLTKGTGLVAIAWLGFELFKLVFADVPETVGKPPAGWGGVADVGTKLFNDYMFPFEALSLMLLVAVIGAVVVARTPKKTMDDHAGGLGPHYGEVPDSAPLSGDGAQNTLGGSGEAHR